MLRSLRDRLKRATPSASVIASFDEGFDESDESFDQSFDEGFEALEEGEGVDIQTRSFPAPRPLSKEPTLPLDLAHPPSDKAVLLLSGDETYTYRLRRIKDRKGNSVVHTMHCGASPAGDGVVLDRFDRRGTLLPGYKFAFVKTVWVLQGKERDEKGRVRAVGGEKSGVAEKGA